MTKKLSFLALFVATVALCAAPALSVKNAYLPDASIALTLNAHKLNNSVLGDFFDHDALGTLAGFLDIELDASDPVMAELKSRLERANITVVSSLTMADVNGDELSSSEAVKKFMVCVELKEALGQLVDVVIAKVVSTESTEYTAAATQINGFKGVNLTDEEGVVIALVFSEDGRLFFVGAPDVLKKQLTAEAAAAPARLTVAQANALDGSFLSVGIVMTDEIKAMATDASPEAAGFASAVDVFLFSAATSGGLVDLQLGASFITPEFAGAVKSMLDTEVVPQVKAMAPAVAGEADVSFVNSLACSQKGNVVNLTCSLSQADIFTVVQLVGKFMDGGSEEVDELDEDVEEFDEDGVEVEEVY
ncbi:MAG: hypothetical protein II943_03225 [Victivallales bacterium]|nr:hypothetical protein [Victivallales bacterium]